MSISDVDRLLGMDAYATTTEGTGGVIKESVEDFVVEEVLVDVSKASIDGVIPAGVIGSSTQKQGFVLCALIKRNWDTLIAAKNVAKSLGIGYERVDYAGIKDARAVTAQFITIKDLSMEEAAKVDVRDVRVIPIGYLREKLSLFYLLGNNFTIAIKHLTKTDSEAIERLERTIQQISTIGGFPNFFGHQRFGTKRPITHLVGKELSQGHFEEAAMLFLAKHSTYEHPESRSARQRLEKNRDFVWAAENYPKQLRFERQMLTHLAENPTDFSGAFRRLPTRLQALFVQAQQSYLFNRFLSERMKQELPLKQAIIGDFVVGVERSGLPFTTMAKTVTAENLKEINASIQGGKMRIALPLIGAKQKLSNGEMGEIEKKILREEGISNHTQWINPSSRLDTKGGLRPILTPLKDYKLQQASKESLTITFTLLRGCYATVLLREILKPVDVVAAGF